MNGEIIVRANISKRASAYISNIRRVEGSKTITDNTPTTLVGVLCGEGGTVGVKAVDTAPTSNSSNLITSGGVKKAIDDAHANLYICAGQRSGQALGYKATAEGNQTAASGNFSHAEGNYTTASGGVSHAEGYRTTASGDFSHAEGEGTTGQRKSQHVFGEYNAPDTDGTTSTRGTYVEIVGNGTSGSARSNARMLDWIGNETLAGKLTLGANPSNDMDAATKKYVDDAIAAITDGNNISY